MAGAVGLVVVDLKVVVGVLNGRNAKSAPGELGDQARGKRRLAGLLPTDDADDGRVAGGACIWSPSPSLRASIARSWSSSCGVLALKNGSISRPQTRAGRNGTATVPWRSVQCRTLRTPVPSCVLQVLGERDGPQDRSRGGARRATGRAQWRPGGPPPPASALRLDRDGSSGASPAAVTIQRASGAFAADQRIPASTPASGPTKPPMVSGTTGRPRGAKRAGSPLALMTTAPT